MTADPRTETDKTWEPRDAPNQSSFNLTEMARISLRLMRGNNENAIQQGARSRIRAQTA